ncbi:MAG: S41 family peptidase, partial [Fimbriiglobus sp.]
DAVGKLATLYVDRDRATPGKLFALGLEELDRAFTDPVFRQRHLPTTDDARVHAFRKKIRTAWGSRPPTNSREARQVARELAFAARDEAGVTNPSAVVLELICGACGGLDESTLYVAPTGGQADLAGPIAEFAGYGILIAFQGSDVVVDGLVPGSWAATHTGLRKGDRLTRLNGRALTAATPAALAAAVREAVTAHEIDALSPDGMGPVNVRLPIPAPTVFAGEMLQFKDGVGYLRLAAFKDATPAELDAAVFDLKSRGMRSLVLDLRGNPGGAFPAAVMVAQRFLPTGVVVTTQGQSPEFAGRVFSSDAGMAAWDFPVVLLVDTKTMSSAEVVAVALKENGRATLVGLPTFGKGAVQSPVKLQTSDGGDGKGGVLVLTVATVTGPRGVPLNGGGVVPHHLEPDPVRQLDQAIGKAAELVGGR